MFSIIIPNYNNSKYLNALFNSIYYQTYQDYEIIFVDDKSTDDSVEIALRWQKDHFHERIKIIPLEEKRWNGGARNVGLNNRSKSSDYTMFIDSDDTFTNAHNLELIEFLIEQNNYPDCIRLSYNFCDTKARPVILEEDTPAKLVVDCNVACWTKCIKSNLMVRFPENTLMEDVVQHIAQCDVLKTVVPCKQPIINWNKANANSCSTNSKLQNGKWFSSMYRYVADLMDLQVTHSYCKEQRTWRIEQAQNNVKNGLAIQ